LITTDHRIEIYITNNFFIVIGYREEANLDQTERYSIFSKDHQVKNEISHHEHSMLPSEWSQNVRRNKEGSINRARGRPQASNNQQQHQQRQHQQYQQPQQQQQQQQQQQVVGKGRNKSGGGRNDSTTNALTSQTNIALAPIETFLSGNFFVLSGPTEQISPFFLQQSLHCYPKAPSLEQHQTGVSNIMGSEIDTTITGKRKKKYKKYPQSKRKQFATDSSESSSSQSQDQNDSQEQDLLQKEQVEFDASGSQNDRIQQGQEQYQLQLHNHHQQKQECENQSNIINNRRNHIDFNKLSPSIGLGLGLGSSRVGPSLLIAGTCAIASAVDESAETSEVSTGMVRTDSLKEETNSKQQLQSPSSSTTTQASNNDGNIDEGNKVTVVSNDSLEYLKPENDFTMKNQGVNVNSSQSTSNGKPNKYIFDPFECESDVYTFGSNIPTNTTNKGALRSGDPWTYDFFEIGGSEALNELEDTSRRRYDLNK
jgi:hypothetical protein